MSQLLLVMLPKNMRRIFFLIFWCFAALHAEKPVLVFDFGGVIIKSDKALFYDFIQQAFQVDDESLVKMREQFLSARSANIPENIFWRRLAQDMDISLPETWEAQYDAMVLHSFNEVPGMRDLIKSYKMQGFQVALFSNVQAYHAAFLRKLGYYDDFSPVILSYKIGYDKPSLEAYLTMLSQIKADPENCIFIDDKQENVDAALALGIDAILFLNLEQIKEELHQRLH